jgi:putative transposase
MGLYPAAASRASPAAGCARRGYPSDLSDGEWSLIGPLLPAPRWDGPAGGRPEAHPRREIVNAIRYLVRSGCAWRALPADFPPWQTVYHYFHRWQADGTTAAIHDALRGQARLAAGRGTEPTAAVIDSQSVRAADTVPRASRGWDAAKKVNGRKRHIAVDATGLLLATVITPASVQDRDAARPLLWNLRRAGQRVCLAWADSGYQGGRLATWAATLRITLQIVRRPDDLHTFQVLPRRWVVERTFAWISKHRRTVRDYERLPAHHEAIIQWAMIATMAARLARQAQPRPGDQFSDTHLACRLTSADRRS